MNLWWKEERESLGCEPHSTILKCLQILAAYLFKIFRHPEAVTVENSLFTLMGFGAWDMKVKNWFLWRFRAVESEICEGNCVNNPSRFSIVVALNLLKVLWRNLKLDELRSSTFCHSMFQDTCFHNPLIPRNCSSAFVWFKCRTSSVTSNSAPASDTSMPRLNRTKSRDTNELSHNTHTSL